jgi:hypothetical protein
VINCGLHVDYYFESVHFALLAKGGQKHQLNFRFNLSKHVQLFNRWSVVYCLEFNRKWWAIYGISIAPVLLQANIFMMLVALMFERLPCSALSCPPVFEHKRSAFSPRTFAPYSRG